MESTKPKEILENMINVMEKYNADEFELIKYIKILEYIEYLEKKLSKIDYYVSKVEMPDTYKKVILDMVKGE